MKFLDEFKKFAMRGNVVDLAVGFIMGTTFNQIVTSLVNDVIMPPIGYVMSGIDFNKMTVIIQEQSEGVQEVSIRYGSFFNALIHFIIVAFAVFLLVKAINTLRKKEEKKPSTKKCSECLLEIPIKAKRCGHCTVIID